MAVDREETIRDVVIQSAGATAVAMLALAIILGVVRWSEQLINPIDVIVIDEPDKGDGQ